MKSNTMDMTNGKPMKLLVSFALPLMFGNIFQQLYTVVDTAIVGQGVGLKALAALGCVDWLNWMMLSIATGFSQGFCVRISQKFGEKDMDGLKKAAGQSIVLSLCIGVFVTIAAQIGLPFFLMLLHVPMHLRPMATLYTRILMGAFLVVMFFNFLSALLRALGDSKTPLKAMVTASITNILLDLLAVFVFDLGIAGAAAATVVSQCLAALICANKIRTMKELLFDKSYLIPEKGACLDLIFLGTPIAAKNMVIAVGGMTVQTVVNGFDMSFIAGFTATNKLYGLLEVAAISYGYAVTTYVGQNYGAGKEERIHQGMKSAILLSAVTAVLIGLLMIVFGRSIVMLFISSEDLHLVTAACNTAYRYLCIMSVFLPVLYLLYVYLSALQGIGETFIPMLSGILEFFIRVGIAVLIAYTGRQNGIFFAEISAWTASMLFLMRNYNLRQRKKGNTVRKKITKRTTL